jgi:hypothetical protein
MKLGDAFHTVAQPVAKGLDKVLGTNIQNCQGCNQRREQLNNFGDAVYDELFQPRKKKIKL